MAYLGRKLVKIMERKREKEREGKEGRKERVKEGLGALILEAPIPWGVPTP